MSKQVLNVYVTKEECKQPGHATIEADRALSANDRCLGGDHVSSNHVFWGKSSLAYSVDGTL